MLMKTAVRYLPSRNVVISTYYRTIKDHISGELRIVKHQKTCNFGPKEEIKSKKMRTVVVLLFLQLSMAMLIPEEAEMLEGFGADFFPELSAEDDYHEAKSMAFGPLFNAIRNKRSINQFETSDGVGKGGPVSKSNGTFKEQKNRPLRKLAEWWKKKFSSESSSSSSSKSSSSSSDSSSSSSSESSSNNIVFIPHRHRRSATSENEKLDKPPETVPSPLKLTKESNGFASNRNVPAAASLVGKFTRSPFEYSKIQHEEDSIAMDSSPINMNDGIKSRTPRVNFVTQQKKSLDHDNTKASATKSDFYKTPPLLHNSKELPTAISSSERYSDKSSTSRPIDNYSNHKNQGSTTNHYDDRYIEDMYPPPPPSPLDLIDQTYDFDGPYDPYTRRYSPYVDYPGNRYLDDYRDYPPIHDNDIDNSYYMRSMPPPPPPPMPASSTLPRKRTIYYAYLPEIVRSPPTVNLRYRSYDRYDPYYNDFQNYQTNSIMRNTYRHIKPNRQSILERGSMLRDYRTARPMNLYNDDMARNNTSLKEKTPDGDRFYSGNKPIPSYSYRRYREYDPYLY